jgi:RNA recognition motif-containing protein
MSFRPPAKPDATKQHEPRYRIMPRSGGPGGKELAPEQREKTLFVGNLDKRVTERHLIQLFGQFGELERVQFMWCEHKRTPHLPTVTPQ